MTTFDRFWAQVEEHDGHWLWVGAVNEQGYGRFWCTGRAVLAHRHAYRTLVGPLGNNEVDHRCTVRRCLLPGHLESVDHETNMARIGETLPALAR